VRPDAPGSADTRALVVIPPDRFPSSPASAHGRGQGGFAQHTRPCALPTEACQVVWHPLERRAVARRAGHGKSMFAQAIAGSSAAALLDRRYAGDLVTRTVGDGPREWNTRSHSGASLALRARVRRVRRHRRRAFDQPEGNVNAVLAQLLQSLEEWRSEPRLVVVATTNELEALDAAVMRPGRFDHHIRMDVPDSEGRIARIAGGAARPARPQRLRLRRHRASHRGTDAGDDRASGGTSGARCDARGRGHEEVVQISDGYVLDAIEERGGKDRPTVERWSWRRLVSTRACRTNSANPTTALRIRLVASAGRRPAEWFALDGPAGDGKTTIAKVLAAESACSFIQSRRGSDEPLDRRQRARVASLFRRARATHRR